MWFWGALVHWRNAMALAKYCISCLMVRMGNDTQRQPVERAFGIWTAIALVMGGMIGSGIFLLPAQVAPLGWTGLVTWLIVIAGAVLLAWVLSRLTIALPGETGVVAICGRALGPLPGVLLGWSYWIGILSANAIIAITTVRYLAAFVHALAATSLALALSATAVIWMLTLLNLAGARAAGGFQVATTALKILPLLAVIAILAGQALAGGERFAAFPHAPFDAAQLTPALSVIFFAMVGFEAASHAAERVRDPARNIGRATLIGVGLTGFLYLLVCSGIVFAMPEAVIANSSAPIALFVETFWGRWAGLATAGFAVIATVGCLNGWVLLQGEVPLGMARAGLLPSWFARIDRRDVPVGVLLLGSAFSSVLVLSNASKSGAALLDFMLRLTTAATLWLYLGICLAALKLGVSSVAAVAGMAFALWAMVSAGFEPVALSLLLMVSALPLYWLRSARPAQQPA